MPSRSELPGNISRRKFVRALKRLGYIIDKKGGNGSHYKIICPKNNKSVTIQKDLRKDVLYYIVVEMEKLFDITWDDIKKEL